MQRGDPNGEAHHVMEDVHARMSQFFIDILEEEWHDVDEDFLAECLVVDVY